MRSAKQFMTDRPSALTLARGASGTRAEQEALDQIARALPAGDQARNRLWANIVMPGASGERHGYEIDALALGHHGLYVIEIKANHSGLDATALNHAATQVRAAARQLERAMSLRIPSLSRLWIQPLVFVPDDDFELESSVAVPVVTPQNLVSVLQHGELGDMFLAETQEPINDDTTDALIELLDNLDRHQPGLHDLRTEVRQLYLDILADLHQQAPQEPDAGPLTTDQETSPSLEERAAIWVLSCGFVHALQRRGLLKSGAMNAHQGPLRARVQLAHLLDVATGYQALDTITGLWRSAANENPLSEQVARRLLDFFWSEDGAARPSPGDGSPDVWTALYGGLSDVLARRHGFVATPRFVAEFMLDLAFEPVLATRGAANTSVCDPACGSGTLLCLAFERLVDAHLRASPEPDPRTHALAALDRVHGIDISAPAALITRARLLFAYLDRAQVSDLTYVPRLPIHVTIGDALNVEERAREHPPGSYAVVLCTPPYVTCKDRRRRDLYRRYFVSAGGFYSLAAPFIERCFSLADRDGMVGVLAPSSFYKREYGKKLIEDVLTGVEFTRVIDMTGAYVPGFATPTLILVAGNRRPDSEAPGSVRMVLGKSVEPHKPVHAEQGRVWSSIRDHHDELGYQDRYISVEERPREVLRRHPWILIAGEPPELRQAFESSSSLDRMVESIRFGGFSGLDDVFLLKPGVAERHGLERHVICPIVTGAAIGDWVATAHVEALIPQTPDGELLPLEDEARWVDFLWPYRARLERRVTIPEQRPGAWWTWQNPPRLEAGPGIVGRSIASWPQFARAPGCPGNRHLLIIRLQESASEDQLFALLGYLDSSAACFWLKQRAFSKSWPEDPRSQRAVYQFSGHMVGQLPVPASIMTPDHPIHRAVAGLARSSSKAASQRAACTPEQVLARWSGDTRRSLLRELADARQREVRLTQRMVCDQEELDWLVYEALGLVDGITTFEDGMARPEERPHAWLSDQPPVSLEQPLAERWTERRRIAGGNRAIALIEHPAYKRPFLEPSDEELDRRADAACEEWLIARLERELRSMDPPRCSTVPELATRLERDAQVAAVASIVRRASNGSPVRLVNRLLHEHAVPFLAAQRYSELGLRKRAAWEETWDQQRRQDAGEAVEVPVPPIYSRSDYRDAATWRLRGKLDVASEPFISYRLGSGQPTRHGWAGWSYAQRAQALMTLVEELVAQGDDEPDTLSPLLDGLRELQPWVEAARDRDPQWPDIPRFVAALQRTTQAFVSSEISAQLEPEE